MKPAANKGIVILWATLNPVPGKNVHQT